MKSYPSIERFKREPIKLHTFDKQDGSNLRFEYSKKRGWYKYGTRKRLFDETDPIFGEAIPLFHNTLADEIEKVLRADRAVVFGEFVGEKSFAGLHEKGDPKKIFIIDVAIYKKGIMPPDEFLDLFGNLAPKYLGNISWNQDFIRQVKAAELDITFEGVVGKRIKKKQLEMFKLKTDQWVKKVYDLYGKARGDMIVSS
jgi:hypothetical protein